MGSPGGTRKREQSLKSCRQRRTESSLLGLVPWRSSVPWVRAVLCTERVCGRSWRGSGDNQSSSSGDKFGHNLEGIGQAMCQ